MSVGLTAAAVLAIATGCVSQGIGTASAASDSTVALNASANSDTESAALEDKSTKLICRKIKPTGSRFGERVCMRPEQWEKYAGHSRRELDRVTRDGLQDNGSGGG